MTPTGFSNEVPTLRLAWDSTCLAQYMKCPLTYYWKYCVGYGTPKTDTTLNFGSAWHETAAYFDELILDGVPRDGALERTVLFAISKGYEFGLELFGKKDTVKRSIYALVRALIWWEGDTRDRTWEPTCNADGTAALEVRFMLPLGAQAPTGEEYMLCGSFDGVVFDNDAYWVLERKTTGNSLGHYFWQIYDPCMQTYLYDYVAPLLYPDRKFKGVIVEALQTGVEFARSESHRIIRTDAQRLHWREVMLYWIRRAEQDAYNNSWEHAINSECSTYGSIYKDVQKRDPRVWGALLNTDLERRELWNPAKMR